MILYLSIAEFLTLFVCLLICAVCYSLIVMFVDLLCVFCVFPLLLLLLLVCLLLDMYAHNQTNGARMWMPCVDSFAERCPWDLIFHTQPDHTVVAPGRPVSKVHY